LGNEKEEKGDTQAAGLVAERQIFCNKSLSLVTNILPYQFNLDLLVTGIVLRIIFDQCNSREKKMGRGTVCML